MDDFSPPLLDLHTGDLDAAGLGALFGDLERHAAVASITGKASGGEYAGQVPLAHAEALEALLRRKVLGVQIRYHWDGKDWIDTVLVRPEGWRVVRINAPISP